MVTETVEPDGTRIVERRPITQADLADDDDNRQSFGGIEFGVGMAFSLDLGDRDRVRDVQLVGPNRVVRVARGDNVRARLILESHYFFTPEGHLPARLFGICNPPPPNASQSARDASTCGSEQAMWVRAGHVGMGDITIRPLCASRRNRTSASPSGSGSFSTIPSPSSF